MADTDPFAHLEAPPTHDDPFGHLEAAPTSATPPPDETYEQRLQSAHTAAADMGHRFVGGLESSLLEANKLAAKFGLWLGHPGDTEDLQNAIKLQQEHEAKVKAEAPDGVDFAHIAGEMADPLNYIGPASAVKGASLIARAARGAIGGAQGGLLTPSEGGDIVGQKLKQAGEGAVAGTVMGSVIPEMSPEAKLLVNEGVRLTPGEKGGAALRHPEEALRSLPITGHFIRKAEEAAREDFNRAIYNRVLSPIGEKYDAKDPVGSEGINKLREKLSSAYDRALRNTTFVANPPGTIPYGLTPAHMTELNNILSLLTQERRDQFNSIINQFYAQRVPANGLMNAEVFKRVESELGAQGRKFSSAQDPDQRALGDAVEEVRDLLREAHAVQNPTKAAELQAVNHAYSRYVSAERGARQRLGSDGVMTPQDFLGGLSAMDSSVRKNRFARGVLDMQDLGRAANKVMSNRLGQSGTPERLFWADAAKLAGGVEGAHLAGVSNENVLRAVGGLGAASVPYLRLPPGWPTANLGSRLARILDPAMQGMTPAAGTAAAQGATQGMP